MKRYAIIWMALLFLFLLPRGGAAKELPLVVIDPAHGGRDGGVVVTEKVWEKELTLKTAMMLKAELEKTGQVRVAMTRTIDTDLPVAKRVEMITKWQPTAVLSLHINRGFGRSARGFEVYFPGFKTVNKGEGAAKRDDAEAQNILHSMQKTEHLNKAVHMAQRIQAQLEQVFPKENRGLREASLELIDDLSVPSIVVEIGFASNRENLKKLTTETSQREIARALSRGILEGIGGK